MAETPDQNSDAGKRKPGVKTTTPEVRAWFVREVIPLEPALTHFLQSNWRNRSDIADLRQEVYVRVLEAARAQVPEHTQKFVFTTARNLLIDRVRRDQVVPIEAAADIDLLEFSRDVPGPERSAIARDDLRRLQSALEQLPPRCRQAVVLRKVEGLSLREIAERMGISERTVKAHLGDGMRSLADLRFGEPAIPGDEP
jgi:RNA polymerase sigma factor (sigma-70 family)